ncbi:MAG: GalNAc-alpha-(1-_4)-GalNAc-alpha-(1-_3)-diNAcBac-PP-undecaprenol alpha-1,4-N-acetyl-D-galactosaminyltransferase [Alteromonadaceae bacterium]|jgi:GalNAc-alpha-(1->4)-GalNAc-alpha-(1->3)-diNAcBac-PP-undecaprenol alpha-1,4-N-acetyl-D-galactosaminyltransferase
MQKILFVIGSMQSGGAERVASRLCSHWAELQNEVTLLTGSSVDSDFYKVDQRVNRKSLEFNYNNNNMLDKIFEQFERFFKIQYALKRDDYNTIVLSATDISIRFMLNLFFSRKKVIICEHNNYYAINSTFKRLARIVFFRRANYLFLLTELDRKAYLTRGFLHSKLVVMPNPLGIPQPEFIDRQPSKKLLAVGRLTKQKSFDRLLKIFELLDDTYTLTIVGNGEDESKLKKLSNELDISDRVFFAGIQKNIDYFYRSHDILLMTSIYEGLPMVIGEANAYSLPVIAYNCPTGPKEMIQDGLSGFLINDDDFKGFVEKINYIFSNLDIYKYMSNRAYIASKGTTIEQVAESWNDYL